MVKVSGSGILLLPTSGLLSSSSGAHTGLDESAQPADLLGPDYGNDALLRINISPGKAIGRGCIKAALSSNFRYNRSRGMMNFAIQSISMTARPSEISIVGIPFIVAADFVVLPAVHLEDLCTMMVRTTKDRHSTGRQP